MELAGELDGIIGDRPVTMEELDFAKNTKTLTLPGSWETARSVAASIGEIVQYGLDDHYFETYADAVRALGVDPVQSAAESVLHPDRLVWVVVGDKASIQQGIRELGIGPMYEIDGDGNVIGELGTN